MTSPVSTAVTYSSRCARSLLRILRQSLERRCRFLKPNSILLFSFAPSSTTPPEVLSDITSTLTQHYPEHVGCISAPLPPQYLDSEIHSVPHSCSLAYALVNGVSFHSAIPGRAETHVGRRHASRERDLSEDWKRVRADTQHARLQALTDLSESSDGRVDWDHVWDHSNATSATHSLFSRHGDALNSEALPIGLIDVDPSTINSVFYFSDKAPEGLERVLQNTFPQANKLSLIASSTPFITGRPVTLFHNGSIFSNGAVGIALTHSQPVDLSFPPLIALSRNLNVTSSKGNMILSLDSGNPTQLLLSVIQKHGLSSGHTMVIGKEDEFYVGVIDPSRNQVSQVHRINAGDPSRGGIALDCASAPREGSVVCLYYAPKDAAPDVLTYLPSVIPNTISLFVAPETTPATSFTDETTDNPAEEVGHPIVSDAFIAASENGFTLSRGAHAPWKCTIPGGHLSLSL